MDSLQGGSRTLGGHAGVGLQLRSSLWSVETGPPVSVLSTSYSRVVNLPGNKNISQGSGKYRELPGNTLEIPGITGKYLEIPGSRKHGVKYYGLVIAPKLTTLK